MNMFKRKKSSYSIYLKLPFDIYILLLARFVNCMGGFVVPFMTLYLTNILGMQKEVAGICVTITSIAYLPGSLLGGKIADHLGRKKVLVCAQFSSALCIGICAVLDNKIIIPILLILSAFFNAAVHPTLNAMFADYSNSENRKNIFSLSYLAYNMGQSVAGIIAGFLFKKNVILLFGLDSLTTIISVVLILLFVRESLNICKKESGDINFSNNNIIQKKSGVLAYVLKRPELMFFAIVATCYSFISAQMSFCIPIHADFLFKNSGSEVYGTLMTINAVTVFVTTIFIANLTKKLKPILNFVLAGLIIAVGTLSLYASNVFWMFVISIIIWAIGDMIRITNAGVYVADNAPISHRARFNAVIVILTGTGYAISPTVMGFYLKYFKISSAWIFLSVLSLMAALLMLFVYMASLRKELIKS